MQSLFHQHWVTARLSLELCAWSVFAIQTASSPMIPPVELCRATDCPSDSLRGKCCFFLRRAPWKAPHFDRFQGLCWWQLQCVVPLRVFIQMVHCFITLVQQLWWNQLHFKSYNNPDVPPSFVVLVSPCVQPLCHPSHSASFVSFISVQSHKHRADVNLLELAFGSVPGQ